MTIVMYDAMLNNDSNTTQWRIYRGRGQGRPVSPPPSSPASNIWGAHLYWFNCTN